MISESCAATAKPTTRGFNDATRHHFALYDYLRCVKNLRLWRTNWPGNVSDTEGEVSGCAIVYTACDSSRILYAGHCMFIWKLINREIKRRRTLAGFRIYVGWRSGLEVVNNTGGIAMWDYVCVCVCDISIGRTMVLLTISWDLVGQ